MRYDQTSLKWGVTSENKLIAAFEDQQSATAHQLKLTERGQTGIEVYDLENDRPVEDRQLEQAGDNVIG